MKHRSTLWMLNKCIRISSGLVNQNCMIMSFRYKFFFSYTLYTEPLPPGRLDLALSNFSATHLFLKWNPPDGNSTLNYYKIVVDGHQQQTFGNIPEIHWNKKLTPGTSYNVTITTVSYGGVFSGPLNGIAESNPHIETITIDKSKLSIYCTHKCLLNLFLFIKLQYLIYIS